MKPYHQHSLEEYLDELSSDKPIPGGGSVSAYVAALAMGLTQMVGRISLKRKKKEGLSVEESRKDDERRATIEKIIASLEKTKRDAFQIVDLDPKVYMEVMSAGKDPAKMEETLQNSFRLQADLAMLVVMASEWNHHMAGLVAGSIKNDLLVSASLLEAAFKGAFHTSMINVKYMKEGAQKVQAEKALDELQKRFDQGKKHDH